MTLNTIIQTIAQRWETASTPTPWLIITTALLATTIAALPQTWKYARQAATIIHELGHATTAALTGRKVTGIKLHTDTSGVTTSEGKDHGIALLLTTLSGYPAPSTLGLALTWATANNHSGAALTILNALLLATLWLSRNVIGFLATATATIALGYIWLHGTSITMTNTALTVATFMLIAGPRCIIDLAKAHREGVQNSDAQQAAKLTHIIPASLWVGIFFLYSIACIYWSIKLIAPLFNL